MDPCVVQNTKFDSNRPRASISRTEAREILIVKSKLRLEGSHHASIRLAAKYRISSKAIRDIWKGRSWLDATFDLWSEEDRPPRRVVGRPKGKKDSKPRVKAQARAGQDTRKNALQNATCASNPPARSACNDLSQYRFKYAYHFNANRASDSGHPSQ